MTANPDRSNSDPLGAGSGSTTHQLMARYAAGDDDVFPELFRRLEPTIRKFVRRRIYDDALVDDILQQTFLRVHRSRASYLEHRATRPGSVRQWFLATASHTVSDYLRREYRRRRRVERMTHSGDGVGFGASSPPLTPEETATRVDTIRSSQATVRQALRRLPSSSRELIRRHKLEGQSLHSIATELGVRPGTLRVRAHRAYQRLVRELPKPAFDAA